MLRAWVVAVLLGGCLASDPDEAGGPGPPDVGEAREYETPLPTTALVCGPPQLPGPSVTITNHTQGPPLDALNRLAAAWDVSLFSGSPSSSHHAGITMRQWDRAGQRGQVYTNASDEIWQLNFRVERDWPEEELHGRLAAALEALGLPEGTTEATTGFRHSARWYQGPDAPLFGSPQMHAGFDAPSMDLSVTLYRTYHVAEGFLPSDALNASASAALDCLHEHQEDFPRDYDLQWVERKVTAQRQLVIEAHFVSQLEGDTDRAQLRILMDAYSGQTKSAWTSPHVVEGHK